MFAVFMAVAWFVVFTVPAAVPFAVVAMFVAAVFTAKTRKEAQQA